MQANTSLHALSNMTFQGTVWGPPLWNTYFEDAQQAVQREHFVETVFADDLNCSKTFDQSIVDAKIFEELNIEITPQHPETELRKAGALYESQTAFRDVFATHVVVDDEKRFVTGQNQNSGLETAHKMMQVVADREQ